MGGSKCSALRNANEKIEYALIDIASLKNEWGYRCFNVPQCLNKSLTNLSAYDNQTNQHEASNYLILFNRLLCIAASVLKPMLP